MGRRSLEVDYKKLQVLIDEHEPTWTIGQSTFIVHVADLYNASVGEGEDKISSATIVNRWQDGHIKINVQKGRKIGQIGVKIPNEHKKLPPGTKRTRVTLNKEGANELLNRKGISGWGKVLIKRVIDNPTLRNRVNMKCGECVGFWDRKDIKFCTINSCPLWDVRPYKNSKIKEEPS